MLVNERIAREYTTVHDFEVNVLITIIYIVLRS